MLFADIAHIPRAMYLEAVFIEDYIVSKYVLYCDFDGPVSKSAEIYFCLNIMNSYFFTWIEP